MAILAYLVVASIATSTASTTPEDGGAQVLGFGDSGPAVATLNAGLAAAGFHAGDGDVFGRKTRHAVYAFQKHHGLATTGRFSPFIWDLLSKPVTLPQRKEAARVEVDLGRQVLYVVDDHEVVLVVPISSGNGEPYIGSNGRRQIATTPEGAFRFQRRRRGLREAPLGVLYNPYYFTGGIAVHGSPSVPNHPASHGCIRVTMWDMDLLLDHLEIGQRIYVYTDRLAPAAPPAPTRPGVILV